MIKTGIIHHPYLILPSVFQMKRRVMGYGPSKGRHGVQMVDMAEHWEVGN